MREGPRLRVIVVPVFKRHWLLHAWTEPGAPAAGQGTLDDSIDEASSSSSTSGGSTGWEAVWQVQQQAQVLSQRLTNSVSRVA